MPEDSDIKIKKMIVKLHKNIEEMAYLYEDTLIGRTAVQDGRRRHKLYNLLKTVKFDDSLNDEQKFKEFAELVETADEQQDFYHSLLYNSVTVPAVRPGCKAEPAEV